MVEFKDLTLREGSQVPGIEIDDAAGRRVLDALADLGIERVEVAFPRARRRESWFRHADRLGMTTAALSRAVPADVEAALEVDPDEVEVIVNASDVQLEHALGKSREEALDLLIENVERVQDAGVVAGATLMDAIRADDAFLREGARALEAVGARHVTLADTTGAGTPGEVRETVGAVADAVDDLAIAVHPHDDMGVGAANALAGVDAGATSVDATVGGVGERAGNAPLEEVAVLLSERGDEVALDRERLVPACREAHEAMGVAVPENKPVLGTRPYRHESGLHTAAMLREPSTYEPFDPSRYGAERELLFGEGTGRGAVRALLEAAGHDPTDDRVAAALDAVRNAAASKGGPLTLDEARETVDEAVA
ncbi:MAG: LeuA family protein [Haloferacaceae archaeon]